jgi:membrane protein DedA with SNARE-associated domain
MTAGSLPVVTSSTAELGGLVGFAATLLDGFGELGVGVLALLETVFPPIPSEVVLPLAGFLSARGELDFVLVLVAATLGGYAGALILYLLGRTLGEERTIRLLSKLPLVDREDFEKAAGWFARHGRAAVFFGRLIPGVRSLISLPAGSARMPIGSFSLFTIAGTLVWNGILVTLGSLLGKQYTVVDRYSSVLNIAVVVAIALVVVALVIRRLRRARSAAAEG